MKNIIEKTDKSKKYLVSYNRRYLKPLEKMQMKKLKEWRNAQMNILRQYTPLTDFHQENWWKHLKDDKNQTLFALWKEEKEESIFIGYCGIVNIDWKNRRGEVSFLLDPVRMASKAKYKTDFIAVLYMLSQYGFGELQLHKFFVDTYDFRKDHIKIIESFGFKKEGELREHYFGEGEYFNSFIHSLLFSEWKNIK